MPKINKTFMDRLSIPQTKANGSSSQVFYRDEQLPGFAVRVTSGGAKSFIVESRINGKAKRLTIGRYPVWATDEARKEAKSLLAAMAKGIDPHAEKRAEAVRKTTLLEAYEDYIKTRKDLKPGTLKDYGIIMGKGLKDWQRKPLVDITKEMVQRKHSKLGKTSHARANNTMRVLRAIFNHAMRRYEDAQGQPVIKDNPVNRLSETRAWYKIPRRQRIIKPSQLKIWYDATQQLEGPNARDYFHLLLFTGLRREEAVSLSWGAVDFENKTFTILDTKNGDPHTLPLTGFIYDMMLKRKMESESQWVFPSKTSKSGYFREPAKAIDKVAAITGFRFSSHDLRRTFVTVAESLDIPAYALKRLMNHRDSGDVTAGYIITDVERLRNPMRQISDFFVREFKDEGEVAEGGRL